MQPLNAMRSSTCTVFLALSLASCGDDEPGSSSEAATDGTNSTVDSTTEPSSASSSSTASSDASASSGGSSPTTSTSATSTSTTGVDADSSSSTSPTDPPEDVELEGYGTLSTFGEGGEECIVSSLEDDGPGTLRDCIVNRDTTDDNPTPRVITFSVGGIIRPASNISIRQPFLTIDGLSAPDPGITIEKSGDGTAGQMVVSTWSPNATCGHDVLVQGIRFRGVWARDSEEHDQNAGTIGIDGEDRPLCVHHVVLNRVTVIDAQDAGGDIWGSVTDVTVQYSAFLYSLHPNTYSHFPGGATDQQRERLSNHHNLYAFIHERGPQVRGDNRDSNFEQNIMHRWGAFGFGGGYAMRLRCRDGVCPQRLNVSYNHFTSAGDQPSTALILGEQVGEANDDDAMIGPEVFMQDNWIPVEATDRGTAVAAFERAPEADVTIYEHEQVVDFVLPNIGAPFRSEEEDAIFTEVAASLDADHR